MNDPSNKRVAILQAACRVVLAEGAAALTLEAAARAAGVSKGGLLYHFPTKEALIVGMIDLLCSEFDAAIAKELARDTTGGPGRWLRAYIEVTYAADSQPFNQLQSALMVAAATNPALLDPLRATFDRWQRHAEDDGLDPAVATLLRLAADGLWFVDMMKFAPPTGSLRSDVRATLLRLAR